MSNGSEAFDTCLNTYFWYREKFQECSITIHQPKPTGWNPSISKVCGFPGAEGAGNCTFKLRTRGMYGFLGKWVSQNPKTTHPPPGFKDWMVWLVFFEIFWPCKIQVCKVHSGRLILILAITESDSNINSFIQVDGCEIRRFKDPLEAKFQWTRV